MKAYLKRFAAMLILCVALTFAFMLAEFLMKMMATLIGNMEIPWPGNLTVYIVIVVLCCAVCAFLQK